MSLKERVGEKSPLYKEQVTPQRLMDFCHAVGSHLDHADGVAPPTFMTVFRKGEFDLFSELGLELSKVLHGEQEFQYFNPIRAGDTVEFQTQLSHVLEKKSATGSLHFMTFHTEVKVLDAVAGLSKTVILVRS